MSHAFHLFSDSSARRDHVMRRLDVRLKITVAAVLFAAILCATKPVFPLSVCALSVAVMLAVKVPRKLVLGRFLPPLGIVSVIVVLQALMTGETAAFSVSLGGWVVTATHEGIAQGILTGSRVFGAVSVLLLLGNVTPPDEIFRGLRWFGMPKLWVELAMLMYRYIFVFLDGAADMATAQKVRLGYTGFRNSLSSVGKLMGAVVVRAVEQSLATHEAMVARGYQGEYPFGGMERLPGKAWLGLLATIGGIGFFFLLLERM